MRTEASLRGEKHWGARGLVWAVRKTDKSNGFFKILPKIAPTHEWSLNFCNTQCANIVHGMEHIIISNFIWLFQDWKKHTGAPFSVLLSGMFPAYYKWKTIWTVLSYTCFEFELNENNENSINQPKNQLNQLWPYVLKLLILPALHVTHYPNALRTQ